MWEFLWLHIHKNLWHLNWNKVLSAEYGINVYKNTSNYEIHCEGVVQDGPKVGIQ